MSETPRTDKENSLVCDRGIFGFEFARQLERELNEANHDIESYKLSLEILKQRARALDGELGKLKSQSRTPQPDEGLTQGLVALISSAHGQG